MTKTEMGWEERVTNRCQDGVTVMMRRVGWQGNSEWRAGKSRKQPSVSDDCLMGAILKARTASVMRYTPLCFSSLPLFFFLLPPFLPFPALSSSRTHYLDRSFLYLHHFLFPSKLSTSQSILCPCCDGLHSLHLTGLFIYFHKPYFFISLFLYLFLPQKLWLRGHEARAIEIEFWLNDSLHLQPLSSWVLTKTVLIEIQPHALQPAKCPCSQWRADEDTKREREIRETEKMKRETSPFVCLSVPLSVRLFLF